MGTCCSGDDDGHSCCSSDSATLVGIDLPGVTPAAPASLGGQLSRFRIEQMDCPTEERLIRSRLESIPGILALEFNLLQRLLGVRHEGIPERQLVEAIAALGMTAVPEAGGQHTRIRIEQMCCPTEERLIRDKLDGLPGITDLAFDTIQRTLILGHNEAGLNTALAAIRELGFEPQLPAADQSPVTPAPRWRHAKLVAAAVASGLAEILHFAELAPEPAIAALALIAIALAGIGVYRKGWIAVKNRNLNINALMSIAVTGAVLIGQWPEAAMVMVLFALAELIEARSLDRARHAIGELMALTPEQATVRQTDGRWRAQPAREVRVGSLARVRPGERIALDGLVTEGYSSVDQSPITGESLPADKSPGSPLYAGTVNQSGSLEFRVTAKADDSTLARIIHAVEQAQSARAPTQRLVDRFSAVYTPVVFALALIVAIIPPLADLGSWFDWIYRALVLLVVACPCALVISTPVSIVSALATAARQGILVKGGAFLENGRRITHLALDKTGTLTHGQPVQTELVNLGGDNPTLYQTLAHSLALHSDHPVSRAIARSGIPHGQHEFPVTAFEAVPGVGVRGVIEGLRYHLGNRRLYDSLEIDSKELRETIQRLESAGKTAVILATASHALAVFAVADTVRESSRAAVAELHRLGISTLMLSGDNPHTAATIAREVGIEQAYGNLLPEDKLAVIKQLSAEGAFVAMAGDGINDAPALARADIGFAMGAMGSDTAIQTADVAIMDDDLGKIPVFIRLSQRTGRILKQNIALAVGIKAVFLALTLAGQATLWMAVFADMGVSLLVVANGLRLLQSHSRATQSDKNF